jgi:hypothetical protein
MIFHMIRFLCSNPLRISKVLLLIKRSGGSYPNSISWKSLLYLCYDNDCLFTNLLRGVGEFMKNAVNLPLEELDRRITHFEDRLKDFIITEEQTGFIKEMLRELKNVKEIKDSNTL